MKLFIIASTIQVWIMSILAGFYLGLGQEWDTLFLILFGVALAVFVAGVKMMYETGVRENGC